MPKTGAIKFPRICRPPLHRGELGQPLQGPLAPYSKEVGGLRPQGTQVCQRLADPDAFQPSQRLQREPRGHQRERQARQGDDGGHAEAHAQTPLVKAFRNWLVTECEQPQGGLQS